MFIEAVREHGCTRHDLTLSNERRATSRLAASATSCDELCQVNVPNYTVRVPDTGEVGPLSEIVNTHWNMLYWEPMKHYFQPAAASVC